MKVVAVMAASFLWFMYKKSFISQKMSCNERFFTIFVS